MRNRFYATPAGIDYDDTFAPVVPYETIRILLVIAAQHDFEITLFDVKTVFLYGNLEEELYQYTARTADSRSKLKGLQIKKIFIWSQTVA